MRQQQRRRDPRRSWSCRLMRTATAMMVPLVIGANFSLIPAAHSADNSEVEGAHGVLRVHGALTESACRLAMTSAWQDIALGDTGTGKLRNVGARGTPVAVQLRLEDCLPGPAANQDNRSGNLVWSTDQPAVSVSFMAPADADNPQLVQVQGTRGVGLRVTDLLGRDVRLGSKGAPLLLTPGQNELTYTVTPERTQAPLEAGAYWAQLNFGLSYD